MMQGHRKGTARASVGFALGDSDAGVAYVALRSSGAKAETLRVPFSCRALPALEGRDVAFAATLAVASEIRRRISGRIIFEFEHERTVLDFSAKRTFHAQLQVPYVLLGCALNRFRDVNLQVACDSTCRDLAARARADVTLHVAA